jgi:thioredoxin reductase (NADPH)
MLDLLIVGAGPAGIACGIAAKKHDLHFKILEKGKLVNSIYNFPSNMLFFSTSKKLEIGEIPFISHSDKPSRREALEYYRRITEFYDLPIKYRTEVLTIQKEKDGFKLETKSGMMMAKKVIICTGYYDHARMLNVPGEDLSKVKHYYDDAHPYIGQKVLVVGGANSACDVALETWMHGAEVTMVVREKTLYQKVKYWILPNIENRIKEGSIKAHFESRIKEIRADEVDIQTPEGVTTIKNDYVLAMTGYLPNYEWLEKIGLKFTHDKEKIPVFNPGTLETTVEGMYIAGVINAGMQTSKLFIENTRHHGEVIVKDIVGKIQ